MNALPYFPTLEAMVIERRSKNSSARESLTQEINRDKGSCLAPVIIIIIIIIIIIFIILKDPINYG